MTKEWVEMKKAQASEEWEDLACRIQDAMQGILPETLIEEIIVELGKEVKTSQFPVYRILMDILSEKNVDYETVCALAKSVKFLLGTGNEFNRLYDQYMESEPMEFDGDILITDPRYIIKESAEDEDWERCKYGSAMEALGITHYMVRETIYGDCRCVTYNTATKEPLGEYYSDTGLIAVFLLDEVLAYNPDFKMHITDPEAVTLIRNFKGTVQFVVTEEAYEWCGKPFVNYSVRVTGHGTDKTSGEAIEFSTMQTGGSTDDAETEKKVFAVTVARTGVVYVEAEDANEAMYIADNLLTDDISWSDGWEVTDAEEADPADAAEIFKEDKF